MEEEHNFSFSISGKRVIAEANLRDETFWTLVADFYGPQAGLELNLDTQRCKNRLLVQVGLIREDNHLTWDVVVGWLKKIFPNHQSAFFQGLIETGIATTLSLGSDARCTFLESEVNFNFVGPLCDIIGVERTTLLEMMDFSEQAQSMEVTNGLILELCNFVAREKLDPIVLVTWLRNFHPLFCKDGDVQKAYRVLRPRVKQLQRNYRNCKTRSYRRNAAMEMLTHSPFQLVREVQVLTTKKRVKKEGAVATEKLKVNIKHEEDFQTPDDKMSSVGLNSNEGNVKIKDEEVPVSIDQKQVGNSPDPVGNATANTTEATEDEKNSGTLLDIAMINIEKLASMYQGDADASKQLSLDLFRNQYSLMCKEHPAIREFESKVAALAKDVPLAPPVEFLHHNAHFLVDVHAAIERVLTRVESDATTTTTTTAASGGQKLGRDGNPKFERVVNFDESATSRYIHMACEALDPSDFPARGYRSHWVAFCQEKGRASTLGGSQPTDQLDSRRYFEAAAGLVHHHEEIPLFFSDLLLLSVDDCPNVVLESLNCDAADDVIQSLVCALAVVYCKILGPYYQLLESAGEYGLFCRYILCLYQKLLEWSKNPSTLLEPEDVNVFLQEPVQERTFNRVFQYCGRWHTNRDLIRSSLKDILKMITAVVDQHLLEFLPGGRFYQPAQEDVFIQISGCPFSALTREYPFFKACSKKAPKKKRAPEQLSEESSLSDDDSSDSSSVGTEESHRKSSPGAKKARVLNKTNREDNFRGLKREPQDTHQPPSPNRDKNYVITMVNKNGGPCKTKQDVDKLMLRFESKSSAEKIEALRCEILYQQLVLDNDDPNLNVSFEGHVYASSILPKLKLVLPRVKPGYSLVLAPKKTTERPKALVSDGGLRAEEQRSGESGV